MTRSLRRRFVATTALVAGSLLLGAWAPASAQTVDELKKKGTINVGLLVDFEYKPMRFSAPDVEAHAESVERLSYPAAGAR